MAEVLSILFFGGIAIFFAYRLYNILGRSEGHMDPPTAPEPVPAEVRDPANRPKVRLAYDGPAAGGLEAISGADSRFDPESFIDGARAAYDMIIRAYAAGDRESLRGLLADRVLENYLSSINGREERGESLKMEIDRIRSAEIADAELYQGMARIKVRFDAEIATETLDKDGQRISGDFAQVNSITEYWTFERDTANSDPNWVLSSVAVA